MIELRDELIELLGDAVDTPTRAWRGWIVDKMLAKYAILPLPEGKERRLTTSREWELPGDRGSITAYPDGTIHERTSGYWNLNEGDDVLAFAAALVAAARYAIDGRITESIRRGEQDVKDGDLTDLDDIAGEAK